MSRAGTRGALVWTWAGRISACPLSRDGLESPGLKHLSGPHSLFPALEVWRSGLGQLPQPRGRRGRVALVLAGLSFRNRLALKVVELVSFGGSCQRIQGWMPISQKKSLRQAQSGISFPAWSPWNLMTFPLTPEVLCRGEWSSAPSAGGKMEAPSH